MITIRKSSERGHSQIGWLNSFHTFCFADYYDPHFMGFGSLRVINEDIVQPGRGFAKHPHQDMEIITYIVEGALEHKDSLGTGSIIKPGEIQRMSAGTGVAHSEVNPSQTESVHLLQIWLLPETKGLQPSYEQKTISTKTNELILIGSPEGSDQAVVIHQDVELFVSYLKQNHSLAHAFKKGRKGWLQLIKGKIDLNEYTLSAGDGVAITEEEMIEINCLEDAELLLFDLA